MITINGIGYTTTKIVVDFFKGDIAILISDSNIITWKLEKYPIVDDEGDINFVNSQSKSSMFNPEQITFSLVGTYYIKATERDINGNYRAYSIYFTASDLELQSTLPFSGETTEVDSNGWSKTLNQYIIKLRDKLQINQSVVGGDSTTVATSFLNGGDSTAEINSLDAGDSRKFD